MRAGDSGVMVNISPGPRGRWTASSNSPSAAARVLVRQVALGLRLSTSTLPVKESLLFTDLPDGEYEVVVNRRMSVRKILQHMSKLWDSGGGCWWQRRRASGRKTAR
jgi:hypothetical protein